MHHHVPQELGQRLHLVGGTTLTDDWVSGDTMELAGTEELNAVIEATIANGSSVTSMVFRFAASEDGTDWLPIPSELGSSGTVAGSHALTPPALGGTASDRIRCTSHRSARYVTLQAKAMKGVGALAATDIASSPSLKVID